MYTVPIGQNPTGAVSVPESNPSYLIFVADNDGQKKARNL